MEVELRERQSAFMSPRTFCLLSVLSMPLAGASEVPPITVHLFDLAGVPEPVVQPAIDIVARLYQEAGVSLKWMRHSTPTVKAGEGTPFRPSVSPMEVSLRLLPKHLSDQVVRRSASKLGIANPEVWPRSLSMISSPLLTGVRK